MILVYAETQDGKVKKSALESVYFGSKLAALNGSSCVALILGPAADAGRLDGGGPVKVRMTLEIAGLGLVHTVNDEIALE